VGLVFLASCPLLLLVGQKEAVEQAADYAYYFLAIGLLAQLEDLILTRYGWTRLKLDLSFAWQPAARVLERGWAAAERAVRQQLDATGRVNRAWLVQIVGTAGLAAVFLWTAFSNARLSIVLALLGGAILFPLVIWGLQWVARTLGPSWSLRLALALIVLPLAAAGMVWLYNLATKERVSRMQTLYNLIDRREDAALASPLSAGESIGVRVWSIQDVERRVLYQHPAFSGASRMSYRLNFPQGTWLVFDVATSPESWDQEGDGVDFAVYVRSQEGTAQVFSTHVDPKHNPKERRWHPGEIDLSPYAGQTITLVLETRTGPAGDYRYDWAGWGEPRLALRQSAPLQP
jgi:hypothetical protein